jgi:hypothetical protein
VHGIPFLAASQGGAMQDPGSGFTSVGPGGRTDIQSGALGQSGATFDRAILNQPTVNQPRFSGGDETLAPVVPSTDKAHKQLEDGGTGMQDPGVQPQRPSADPESNANGPQSDADGDSALPAPELIDPSN